MITIKYFASLREKIGRAQDMIEFSDGLTIQRIWSQLNEQVELGGIKSSDLLCSQNMEYAQWDTLVNDGDEIAFFPPVTGG